MASTRLQRVRVRLVVKWQLIEPRAVDGDTVAGYLTQAPRPLGYGLMHTIYTGDDDGPAPRSIRLIIVDTPERGQPGWREAKRFVAKWLTWRWDTHLMVDTYESGGWDRLMGDVYRADDRGDTLTQALLREGYGTYRP